MPCLSIAICSDFDIILCEAAKTCFLSVAVYCQNCMHKKTKYWLTLYSVHSCNLANSHQKSDACSLTNDGMQT